MVIAREASETVRLMTPLGLSSLTTVNVAHRTHAGTSSTADAAINRDMKGLVGDEKALKETAHRTGKETGQWTTSEILEAGVALTAITSCYDIGYLRQGCSGLALLASFIFRGIYIHKGQSNVGLGHNERCKQLGMNPLGLQMREQSLHGAPDGIASRDDEVVIVSLLRGLKGEPREKAAHQPWGAPTVNGKHQSHPFVGRKRINALILQCVGHIDKPFAKPLSQCLRYPKRIACT